MRNYDLIPEVTERIATRCIDAAMQVHRQLGPGFKEIIYHRCYRLELDLLGLTYKSELPILVRYRTWDIPGQRVDLLVENAVLIEIKTVPKIKRIHQCQVVSYLRTLDLRLGLILNFNAELMMQGIKRVAR
jgi:GxxExxY protein